MPDGQMLPPSRSAIQNPKVLTDFTAPSRRDGSRRPPFADPRSILSCMDIATLCVSPDLKLRLFTASAGRLLGIGPQQLGVTFAPSGAYGLHGTMMARIRAVLFSGIAQEGLVQPATDPPLLCRLLPLRRAGAAAGIDGVIITFTATKPVAQAAVAPSKAPGPQADHAALRCGLTRRQHQVLDHVLAGHPSKNIAADLGISQRTVENHRAAIMARTGATSLPALARLAIGADVGGDCKPLRARAVSK